MKEYGGYIGLDTYTLPMLHEGAVALNCGRSCLGYLIKARGIKKLLLPYFICDSVTGVCEKYGVAIRFYSINEQFLPVDVELAEDEWLYVVNYYGQLTHDQLSVLKARYGRVIVDNAQAYFDEPLPDTDTLYTCRKFFGVTDGAFLYTDAVIDEKLSVDESFERMHFLLGRFERTASEFYKEYTENNHLFAHEPIKRMSKLTTNLLHGLDYNYVKKRRTENFSLYHEKLNAVNQLSLRKVEGAFAYPLWISGGAEIRRQLQQKKIYIPMLWPSVRVQCGSDQLECALAEDILPLPCDQRYFTEDVKHIISSIKEISNVR